MAIAFFGILFCSIPASDAFGQLHLIKLILAACAAGGRKEIHWSYETYPNSPRVPLSSTGTTVQFVPPVANRAYNIFVRGKCNDNDRPFDSMIRVYPPVCCPYDKPRVATTGSSETTMLSDYNVVHAYGTLTITPRPGKKHFQFKVQVSDILGRVLYSGSEAPGQPIRIPLQSTKAVIVTIVSAKGIESKIFVDAK